MKKSCLERLVSYGLVVMRVLCMHFWISMLDAYTFNFNFDNRASAPLKRTKAWPRTGPRPPPPPHFAQRVIPVLPPGVCDSCAASWGVRFMCCPMGCVIPGGSVIPVLPLGCVIRAEDRSITHKSFQARFLHVLCSVPGPSGRGGPNSNL